MQDRLSRNDVTNRVNVEDPHHVRDAVVALFSARYPGADLGILVTRGRFLDDRHELTDRARRWIDGVNSQFRSEPIAQTPPVRPEPFGFKML